MEKIWWRRKGKRSDGKEDKQRGGDRREQWYPAAVPEHWQQPEKNREFQALDAE